MSNSVGGKGGDCVKKEKEFNNVNTSKCFREVRLRAGIWGKYTLKRALSVDCLDRKQSTTQEYKMNE